MSKNTISMVFVELRLILAFFGCGDGELFIVMTLSQSRTHGSLFHLSVHVVIADNHTRDRKNTNITTSNVNTAMSLGTLPYQD
jgi:hypothetical protein